MVYLLALAALVLGASQAPAGQSSPTGPAQNSTGPVATDRRPHLSQPQAAAGKVRRPRIQVLETKSIDWLTEAARWENSDGPEGRVSVEEAGARAGKRAIHFRVDVNWYNKTRYPIGWPSLQYKPQKPLDLSGYDMIRFWVRADSSRPVGRPILRFILHTAGKVRVNKPIAGLRWGEWRQAAFDLSGVPDLDKVTLIHFFIAEADYRHGDRLHFVIDGFELAKTRRGVGANPPDKCAVQLFIKPTGRATIVDDGTAKVPATVVVYTGRDLSVGRGQQLVWRSREMFSGRQRSWRQRLPGPAKAASRTLWDVEVPLGHLAPAPGYYLILCDIEPGDAEGERKSLTDGWMGSDDVYVRARGEPMIRTVLGLRLAMAAYVRDALYGGLMGRTNIDLPHTFDPFRTDTYVDFVRHFAVWTGKHAEGLEAGLSGLAFAAEALRRNGDDARAEFADWLLRNSLDYMVACMLLDDGSTLVHRNDLMDDYGPYIGSKGPPTAWGMRDSNQMGEWLRPLARAVIYWRRMGLNADYCERLLRAGRRVANFLVRESVDPLGQWNNVMYHYRYFGFGPEMRKKRYWQEGRQCDVYVGRALSGLAYYAYALAVSGHRVPQEYIDCLRDTTAWAYAKMKAHDGWFDYQCGDQVEGGCHTYLGNIYIGEATLGWYLVARTLGLKKDAAEAAAATTLAYDYLTQRCYYRGHRFYMPLEFWVGPYLYWEFTEYLGAIGDQPTLRHWLTTMHEKWAKERKWEDFVLRQNGRGLRTGTNGALETSILGYLGLRAMQESGQPFRYF